MNCGICGAPTGTKPVARVEAQGNLYEIFPCVRCGGAGTFPVPSAGERNLLYGVHSYREEDGSRFNAFVEGIVGWARDARCRRIERLAGRRGRLLDIGCGRALFLCRMRRAGWEVAGVEADAEAARRISEARGVDVRSGDPVAWGFPEESFDVVTLHHVLEHVPHPADMIARCRRLLRNGGLLVVAVPNLDSLQAMFGRDRWFHLDVPLHLHHFPARTLASLLSGTGFRVLQERHLDLEQNLFGWIQTLLNRCGLPRNLLFEFLKKPKLRDPSAGGGKGPLLAVSLALLPVIVPAAVALMFLEAAVGRGGTVEIAAVKEGGGTAADAHPSHAVSP